MKKLVLKDLNLGAGDILQKKELKTIFGGYTWCCQCPEDEWWEPCRHCDSQYGSNGGCNGHPSNCGTC